eukprot:m.308308 g.308308  ORF g.308308 m.308308 type:complete len:151 (+) comp19631_c1_seq12:246-698(+)
MATAAAGGSAQGSSDGTSGSAQYGPLCDIAVNLTDPMFRGSYRGKQKHEDDLDLVLARAEEAGVSQMMITGTSLSDSKAALEMAAMKPGLFSTVGCHPTRCNEFEEHEEGPDAYYDALLDMAKDDGGKVEHASQISTVGLCLNHRDDVNV